MTITALLLDVEHGKTRKVTIENELQAYYKILNVDTIDIVTREVGGVTYDIVCDDNGLWKSNPKISMITNKFEPILVGNLLFTHHDYEGNLTSLSDADIKHLRKNVRRLATTNHPTPYPIMTNSSMIFGVYYNGQML